MHIISLLLCYSLLWCVCVSFIVAFLFLFFFFFIRFLAVAYKRMSASALQLALVSFTQVQHWRPLCWVSLYIYVMRRCMLLAKFMEHTINTIKEKENTKMLLYRIFYVAHFRTDQNPIAHRFDFWGDAHRCSQPVETKAPIHRKKAAAFRLEFNWFVVLACEKFSVQRSA